MTAYAIAIADDIVDLELYLEWAKRIVPTLHSSVKQLARGGTVDLRDVVRSCRARTSPDGGCRLRSIDDSLVGADARPPGGGGSVLTDGPVSKNMPLDDEEVTSCVHFRSALARGCNQCQVRWIAHSEAALNASPKNGLLITVERTYGRHRRSVRE